MRPVSTSRTSVRAVCRASRARLSVLDRLVDAPRRRACCGIARDVSHAGTAPKRMLSNEGQSESDRRDGEVGRERDGACVRPERQQADEEWRAKEGKREAAAAAGEAERGGFEQCGCEQACAAGAERDADGSVALAAGSAGQQQSADVRAHHQQQRGESPQQQRERMAEGIAQRKGALGGGHERALRLRIVGVLALMDGAIDAGELLLRLRQRDAGLQAGEDSEVAIGIRIGEGFIGEQRLRAEGQPHVRALVDAGSEEALGHDADDHEWLALDGERGAQDGSASWRRCASRSDG